MDPSNAKDGRYLIRRLPEFNPWWENGTTATVTEEFDSLRSPFYELHQSVVTEDQTVYPLVGPDGVGKTIVLTQLISALIDSDFVEKFYRTPEFRSEARASVVSPEHVLYIPFEADALTQVHGPTQLEAAIDYYETHYLRSHSDSDPHYILLDDVDTLLSRSNPETATQLYTVLSKLLAADSRRQIILTATPTAADMLGNAERDDAQEGENALDLSSTRLLPLSFDDFLRGRFRELETAASDERFHPGRVQASIDEAVTTGDLTVVADQLRTEIENAAIQPGAIRREFSHYLTVGGYLGQRLVSPVEQRDRRLDSVLRGQSTPDIESRQETVRDEITQMLQIRGPEAGVRQSPSKLVQLAALVATEYPAEATQFTAITELLDIDRRTLRDSFLPVLSQLHLVTPSREYANQRPRAIRLYHRDAGIANAFASRDLNAVLRADRQLEAALTKSVLFDHTVRLSNSINDPRDPKAGVVKYWAGDDGEVDFIPKIHGRPIPIYWSGHQRLSELLAASDPPGGFEALISFLQSDAHESDTDPLTPTAGQSRSDTDQESRRSYSDSDGYHGKVRSAGVGDGDPPFGIVITADRETQPNPVRVEDPDHLPVPLLELPQWVYLRLV